MTISGISGTTGGPADLGYTAGNNPTSNDQYSVTRTFTSDLSGNLTFDMSDTYTNAGSPDFSSGVCLNAVVLSQTPEPSGLGLMAVGLIAGFWIRRQRVV